jgi:hypothetical protein
MSGQRTTCPFTSWLHGALLEGPRASPRKPHPRLSPSAHLCQFAFVPVEINIWSHNIGLNRGMRGKPHMVKQHIGVFAVFVACIMHFVRVTILGECSMMTGLTGDTPDAIKFAVGAWGGTYSRCNNGWKQGAQPSASPSGGPSRLLIRLFSAPSVSSVGPNNAISTSQDWAVNRYKSFLYKSKDAPLGHIVIPPHHLSPPHRLETFCPYTYVAPS